MDNRLIFLVGLMGTGKTTLGRALARRNPWCRFVDLDEETERRCGMSVTAIFDTLGEEGFRQAEAETLDTVIAMAGQPGDTSHMVVATGGGTPCRPGAMEKMNAAGLTVLLEASEQRLVDRLAAESDGRPLIAGKTPDAVRQILRRQHADRARFYDLAKARFDSDRLDNAEEVAATCRIFENQFFNNHNEK